MITLYGMGSPNVQKILLMLEELGLPYQFRFVDIWSGDQFAPEFRRLNPNGKVPVLVDDRGPEPLTIFESGAILIHLAEEAGRLLPSRGAARAEVLQWLMIQMTSIGPMFGQFVHFTRYQKDIAYAEARYRTEALRLMDVLDERLGTAPWLGGADYSIADVATYPWLRGAGMIGLPTDGRPNLARWLAAVAERPGTVRFLKKMDTEIRPASDAARQAAAAESLDRLVGRGRFSRVA